MAETRFSSSEFSTVSTLEFLKQKVLEGIGGRAVVGRARSYILKVSSAFDVFGCTFRGMMVEHRSSVHPNPFSLLFVDSLEIGLVVSWTWLDTTVHLLSRLLEPLAGRSKELISAWSRLCLHFLVLTRTWSGILVLNIFPQMCEILYVGLVDKTLEVAANAL